VTNQRVRIGLALVAMLGAAVAQVAFQSPAGAATKDSVVRYAAQDPGAAHVVLQGTKVPGGCKFTASGTGSAARKTVVKQVETAFDAASCTSYLDRTVTAAAAQPAAAAAATGGGAGRGGAARTGARTADGVAAPLVARCLNPYRNTTYYYSRDACVHSWFQDVNGVHVNDIRNEVQWNPYGGCATYGASWASYYYTLGSGWANNLDRFASSFSCSGVTSQTSEGFYSNAFCGYPASDRYDPGYVTGRADGSYAWSVTWYKSASCTLAFGQLDES
jgi:hypothetical protein